MFKLITFHSSLIAQYKPLKLFELKRDLIVLCLKQATLSEPQAISTR